MFDSSDVAMLQINVPESQEAAMIPLCNQICCASHPQELCPDNFRNNVNLTKTQVLIGGYSLGQNEKSE